MLLGLGSWEYDCAEGGRSTVQDGARTPGATFPAPLPVPGAVVGAGAAEAVSGKAAAFAVSAGSTPGSIPPICFRRRPAVLAGRGLAPEPGLGLAPAPPCAPAGAPAALRTGTQLGTTGRDALALKAATSPLMGTMMSRHTPEDETARNAAAALRERRVLETGYCKRVGAGCTGTCFVEDYQGTVTGCRHRYRHGPLVLGDEQLRNSR